MDLIFGFKLTVVPLLIGAVSLVEKRWGSVVAGLLASFPIVAGPIFLFLTLEHGDAYGVSAAIGTLLGVIPLAAFALAYSWACRRFVWWICLLLGWVVFVSVALLLQSFQPPLFGAGMAAIAMLLMAPKIVSQTSRANVLFTAETNRVACSHDRWRLVGFSCYGSRGTTWRSVGWFVYAVSRCYEYFGGLHPSR